MSGPAPENGRIYDEDDNSENLDVSPFHLLKPSVMWSGFNLSRLLSKNVLKQLGSKSGSESSPMISSNHLKHISLSSTRLGFLVRHFQILVADGSRRYRIPSRSMNFRNESLFLICGRGGKVYFDMT